MKKNTLSTHSASARCVLALTSLALSGAALAQTTQTLKPITVQGSNEESLPTVAPGGQAATGARLGVLGNRDILDAPVSINAYTEQLIQDQQSRTVGEVLQNDPAVRYTTNSGHMLEHFRIRGLDVNGPSVALNGLFGMAPKGHIPTEFLERVEVLRGPSAMLAGMSPDTNLGGTVNLVTKRATAQPITTLTTSYSSKSYGEAHVDIGRRFGQDQRLGLRFNGAYGNGDTGVADQKKGRQLGAIALDYKGDGWRLALDAYSSREKIENGSPAMYGLATRRGSAVGVGQLVDVPDSDTNLFRGTHGTYKDKGFTLRGDIDINENLSAYASVGAANSRGQGLMFGTRVIVTGLDGSAKGYVYNVDTVNHSRVAETGLRGHFNTGSIRHDITASASVLTYKDGSSNTSNEGWNQNIYDPVDPVFPAAPNMPSFTTDNILSSYALTDTLDMANGKVLLTLGARLQRVKQKGSDYDETRLSPSVGLVVKPWGENTSLYANYMEGLSPGQVVGVGYDNQGEAFKPLQTKQQEIGLKQRLGGYTHTLSAFQIERPTLITSADGKRMIEGGKQRVQGLEWNMFGQLTPTLNLLGGVAYTKAKQRNTGKDSYGVPDWTANLGLEWLTPVQGLSVGGRAVYTGRQWVDSANTLEIPSWVRYDLSAKYETRISSTPVTFNLYVENVANRKYWSGMFSDGYVMPSSPRTIRLAATFAF